MVIGGSLEQVGFWLICSLINSAFLNQGSLFELRHTNIDLSECFLILRMVHS